MEMAAPVTPNWKTYIATGKKNTAAKFPSPARSFYESLKTRKQSDVTGVYLPKVF